MLCVRTCVPNSPTLTHTPPYLGKQEFEGKSFEELRAEHYGSAAVLAEVMEALFPAATKKRLCVALFKSFMCVCCVKFECVRAIENELFFWLCML